MTKNVRRSNGGKRIGKWLAIAASALLTEPAPGVFAAEAPAISNPAAGRPLSAPSTAALDVAQVAQNSALWPKAVTLLKAVSVPVIFEGRVAGETLLPAGTQLRLLRVLATTQVEVDNQGYRQLLPAESTDLLGRAMRLRNAIAQAQVAAGAAPNPASPVTAQSLPSLSTAVGPLSAAVDYGARAREVADEIQRDFYNPDTGLYSEKPGGQSPCVVWGCGVMFSALVGAARSEPARYQPVLKKFFDGLDGYWDRKQPLGGYEPLPTGGNGNDKYYDDNEWLVIAFLEAYEVTHQPAYAQRAKETLRFVLSGWDETYLKGGIWWHEAHEKKVKEKNTCANAPAAVGCLQMARVSPPGEQRNLVGEAEKIVDWTVANLQMPNALFADTRAIDGNGGNKAQLTYNSALMVRAELGLYHATGKRAFLENAQRIAVAANAFADKKTGVFRDAVKWAHLMAEADLALYRTTREPYLLERARTQADASYERWQEKGPEDLITVASYSRLLWLMADMQTEAGRSFWAREDKADAGVGMSSFP